MTRPGWVERRNLRIDLRFQKAQVTANCEPLPSIHPAWTAPGRTCASNPGAIGRTDGSTTGLRIVLAKWKMSS
jgi:hypothetical protein